MTVIIKETISVVNCNKFNIKDWECTEEECSDSRQVPGQNTIKTNDVLNAIREIKRAWPWTCGRGNGRTVGPWMLRAARSNTTIKHNLEYKVVRQCAHHFFWICVNIFRFRKRSSIKLCAYCVGYSKIVFL